MMYPKIFTEYFSLVSLISPSDRHSIRERDENEADKNRGCGGQFFNERSGGGEGAGSGKKQGNPLISRSLSLSDRLVYLSGGKKFGCMHA